MTWRTAMAASALDARALTAPTVAGPKILTNHGAGLSRKPGQPLLLHGLAPIGPSSASASLSRE